MRLVLYNPRSSAGRKPVLPMSLLALGAVFLKGFKEAIGVALVIVVTYLALNLVVIVVGLREILRHPTLLGHWRDALYAGHGSVFAMAGVSLLLFPHLALGLSLARGPLGF